MRFFRRSRTHTPPAPAPLEVLLDDLDRLAGEGNWHARGQAALIREHGERALARFLADVAQHVADCPAWATVDPVCAAYRRYELSTTGVDLALVPDPETARRLAYDRAQAQAVVLAERQRAAAARIAERAAARRLDAVRAAATRR